MAVSGSLTINATDLYAHTPGQVKDFHLLIDHLVAVAELAKDFGDKFGGADICRLLGLVHDLGKANPAFQEYLRAAAIGASVTRGPGHSDPGAAAVQGILGHLSAVVQGHHGGLPSVPQMKARLRPQVLDERAVSAAKCLYEQLGLPSCQLPEWVRRNRLDAEMFVRMCLSALADADFLDTEKHFGLQSRNRYQTIEKSLTRLEQRLVSFEDDARPVTRVRREVQAACREKGRQGRGGFYRLTVPTGGGKTLASLLFALHNAASADRHRERVVVAIPYTSIIQQTSRVFEASLGQDAFLEHHSAIELDDVEDRIEQRRRLAAENWDCPIVLTTTVQLFDSLFARRPSQVRKIHRLANSVIVLDEVQTLPADMLQPCLDALSWLVRHANATVVLCTATQPDYVNVPGLPDPLCTSEEITDDPPVHFAALQRVHFIDLGRLDPLGVAEHTRTYHQCLTILNSKKDSLAVFKALQDPDAFYLSTLLCGSHRRDVLEQVRTRLRQGQPCHLISTQVVEAGVDLDFPTVLRARGPLSSIVQGAGRCNREGRADLGLCGVFDLVGGSLPPGEYRVATASAERFLVERLQKIESPEVQAEYFRLLYTPSSLETDRKFDGGRNSVQKARADRDYPTVAEHARLIQEKTETMAIEKLLPEEVLSATEPSRGLFRRIGPYVVSLFAHEVAKHRANGLVRDHPLGFAVWTGDYDDKVGIANGVARDPMDLIT